MLRSFLAKPLKPYRNWLARLRGQTPPLTPDLAAWAEAGGAGQMLGRVGEPATVRRALPPHPAGADARVVSLFEKNQTYPVYPRPVVQIPGALLCGSEGFLRLPDGSYTLQTAWYPDQVTLHQDYYRRQPKPVVEMPGTYFSLVLYWSRLFYHWIAEDLPLLQGVAPFLPADTRFLVPGPLSRFHRDSLEMLGLSADRWAAYDGTAAWRLENLIFAPPATTSFRHLPDAALRTSRLRMWHPTEFDGPFNQSPEAIRWVSAKMVAAACGAAGASGSTPRRIYISRSKAAYRKIANAADFEAMLAAHGFQTCHLEDLPLAEQVRLFHGADVVVGPHGAGLSNLMFCRPGTRVVEIFEPSIVRLCYWSISSLMGLNYRYYIGAPRAVPHYHPNIQVGLPEFADNFLKAAF